MTKRRTKIIILGAGGHAREVLDILRAMQADTTPIEPLGFVDDNADLHGRVIDGLTVFGGFEWLERYCHQRTEDLAVVCAVGAPAVRRSFAQRVRSLGLRFVSALSPRAVISPNARIGDGVMVFPYAVVGHSAEIGDHVILNVASTVSHDSRVHQFCTINPGAHLAGNVTVGEGASLGMGCTVIQGISIGQSAVIGAGAAVIRDVPSHVTAVGIPARIIKSHEPKSSA